MSVKKMLDTTEGGKKTIESTPDGHMKVIYHEPPPQKKSGFDLKVIGLIFLLFYGFTHQKELGLNFDLSSVINHNNDGDTDITVIADEPSSELKRLVEPLMSILNKGPKDPSRSKFVDCMKLGDFYFSYKEILLGDPNGVVKTTGQIRQANMDAGTLMFSQTGIKGQYDGLGEAVDHVLMEGLGSENKTVDKDRARQVFNALAWAAYNCAKTP